MKRTKAELEAEVARLERALNEIIDTVIAARRCELRVDEEQPPRRDEQYPCAVGRVSAIASHALKRCSFCGATGHFYVFDCPEYQTRNNAALAKTV